MTYCWLLPCSPVEALIVLMLAHLLDMLYPRHRGLLLKLHPVHTAFHMARRLAPPYASKARGVAAWFTTVALHLAMYGLILYTAYHVGKLVWILAASYVLKLSFSLRLLLETVVSAAKAEEAGDEFRFRWLVQSIVRRNVWVLDRGRVRSAAIESLAESLVDGYAAPLTYYALGGPLAALFQRLVNTLDSALGYKLPAYRERGWFSAIADTVVNYVPARLTAILYAIASARPCQVLRCIRGYVKLFTSRNAGYPITAIAAALGVVLEKPGSYRVACGDELPTHGDVLEAVRLTVKAVVLILFLTIVICLARFAAT